MLLGILYHHATKPQDPPRPDQTGADRHNGLNPHIFAQPAFLTGFSYSDIQRLFDLSNFEHGPNGLFSTPSDHLALLLQLQKRHSFESNTPDIKRTISGDHALNGITKSWIATGHNEQRLLCMEFRRPDLYFPTSPPKHYSLFLIHESDSPFRLGRVLFFICGIHQVYRDQSGKFSGIKYMPYEIMLRTPNDTLAHIRDEGITATIALHSVFYGASAIQQIARKSPFDPGKNWQTAQNPATILPYLPPSPGR